MLQVEADALIAASQRLDESFLQVSEIMHKSLSVGGKIVVTGMGKSGNVAQKVAATLTSTGSMAIYLHPVEALHGDLGILGAKDTILVFSHSGSSQEIMAMLPSAKELCANIVAVLGNKNGTIAKLSSAVISSSVSAEACPDNLAPTASSTVALGIGDALAMVLKRMAGFGPEKYAKFHPGGQLGKRLLTYVRDLMHGEGEFAMLTPDASMDDIVIALTKYRHSGVCIVDGKTSFNRFKLVGVVVEGDIRRALSRKEAFFQLKAQDIMTKKPLSVSPEVKATEALEMMENRETQLSFLPVIDEEGGCVGVLRIHDLVLAGLA